MDLICNEMLPKVASEGLADFVDIFCEEGYFSVADTDRLLSEAKKYNLIPKIHVNQFTAPECPVCSGPMQIRKAGKGKLKGQRFWGCVTFPACGGKEHIGW